VILRCTARLLDLIGTKSIVAVEPSGKDWYGSIFWLEGRKCVLLVQASTLYSALALDIRVGDLRPPGGFVFTQVVRALDRDGLPRDTFGALDAHQVQLAKTVDRSVVGSMNDMTHLSRHIIGSMGGLACCDLGEVHRLLHGTPNGARGYATPFELVRASVDKATG
jgi:Domain of unknown function (DUF6933)